MFFVERHEAEELGVEVEFDFANRAMAVFADDEFGDVCRHEIWFIHMVIVNAVEEHDKVGVLLDGARFTEVGKDRAWVVATGDGAGELSKGDDGDF